MSFHSGMKDGSGQSVFLVYPESRKAGEGTLRSLMLPRGSLRSSALRSPESHRLFNPALRVARLSCPQRRPVICELFVCAVSVLFYIQQMKPMSRKAISPGAVHKVPAD